ncbi:hypothetical protein C4G66_RS25010 [Vibrio parahaemolyticus]|uniref:hypothetical protein n=1 Tax=Vibrio parahaemolyticus TaxID=670 RepID=UPI00111E65A3|nr:hypothetical protein [Vibrio parahaemolyticus]EJG0990139.1 hypothetical protein [Vibrio parahaemolyticus]EJG1072217.1 hypothetical protein [Vibrio parahaemolyticus]MBE4422344.1 hypothetical protein [Vibrio parahaemolyticus]TOJ70146.1 hypothetical protein CGI34_06860 [Vibrio parahaemolyticus]
MKYSKSQISDVFTHLKKIESDTETSREELDEAISSALDMIQKMLDLMIELDPDMEKSGDVRTSTKTFIDHISTLTNKTLPRMRKHSQEYASVIDILSEGDTNG